MLNHLRSLIAGRRNDETGASAVEYGLLVALIAAVIVVAVFTLGGFVSDTFDSTCTEIEANDNANSTASC